VRIAFAILSVLVFIFLVSNITCNNPKYEIVDLGTIGNRSSYATGINEMDQVIGTLETVDGDVTEHAFFWDSANGMIELNTPDGVESRACAINNAGQVVGYIFMPAYDSHSFFWDRTNGIIDLGTFGGKRGGATAINDAGQVVGWAETASNDRHGFLWDITSGMTDLCTFGEKFSSAESINNAGQVVGFSRDTNEVEHIFLWDRANGMIDLGTSGKFSESIVINDTGQVIIGWAENDDHLWRAIFWDHATGMTELGTFKRHESYICDVNTVSYANAINNAGQVVGYAEKRVILGVRKRAFIWDSINGMVNLGTISFFKGGPILGNESVAVDINDSGQVIGYTGSILNEVFGFGRAWLWDKNYGMIKLDDLLPPNSGWRHLIYASAINNRGQIVGGGITVKKEFHAFLMTPVLQSACK